MEFTSVTVAVCDGLPCRRVGTVLVPYTRRNLGRGMPPDCGPGPQQSQRRGEQRRFLIRYLVDISQWPLLQPL